MLSSVILEVNEAVAMCVYAKCLKISKWFTKWSIEIIVPVGRGVEPQNAGRYSLLKGGGGGGIANFL